MRKILVVVDVQEDFVTGTLGFPAATRLPEPIAQKVEEVVNAGGFVYFTKDQHFSASYCDTHEGRHLPIVHCAWGTPGEQIVVSPQLTPSQWHEQTKVITKHTFGAAEFFEELQYSEAEDICEFEICGLVTNMCVLSNAIIIQSLRPNARIKILAHLCAAPKDIDHRGALQVMEDLHMEIVYD